MRSILGHNIGLSSSSLDFSESQIIKIHIQNQVGLVKMHLVCMQSGHCELFVNLLRNMKRVHAHVESCANGLICVVECFTF